MKAVKDREKFSRVISKTTSDPMNKFIRQAVMSSIGIGIDLQILEIDEFTTEKLLGSGTSSDVRVLVRKDDGQKFAGKFVKREVSTEDFINEATLLNSCPAASSTVIKLVGIITWPRCLVLEFYRNGNLKNALKEDNLNIARGMETEFPFLLRLGYILDICRAVDHLHRANICHRDIAMRNLLLSDDKKHVVLTDFSLSRILKSASKEQKTLTLLLPQKSAPETHRTCSSTCGQEEWLNHYSLKSDIWSLGITMYEIIKKQELGDVKNRKDMPSRFPKEQLPPKKVFNRMQDLWIIILRCWNEVPEERPQSWVLVEEIGMLVADPCYFGHEHDDYICGASKGHRAGGSIFDDLRRDTHSTWSDIACTRHSLSHEHYDEWYSRIGSYCSGSFDIFTLTEEVSPRSRTLSTKRDFFRPNCTKFKFGGLGIQEQPGMGQWMGKQRQRKSLGRGDDSYRWSSTASKPQLVIGKGKKILKMLESVSSAFSSGARLEESNLSKTFGYCSPLSLSFYSTATNIRYCKERHFFKNTRSSNFFCTQASTKEDSTDEESEHFSPSGSSLYYLE